MLPGAERAALYTTAQHHADHPAWGFTVLAQTVPKLGELLCIYDDDPALAACQIIDVLPAVIPQLTQLLSWARSLNAGDPSDIPEKGARLPSKAVDHRGIHGRVHQTPA